MIQTQTIKMHFHRLTVPCNLLKTTVCGGVDGEFSCDLTIESNNLDDNGFLIEVTEVETFIRNAFDPNSGALIGSCELLGQGVIASVLRCFTYHDLAIPMKVTCRVFNLVGHIESTWDATVSTDHPTFPRFATEEELEAAKKLSPERRGSC